MSMRIWALLVLVLAWLCVRPAGAAILPSFYLESAAWSASDIVVARIDSNAKGHVQVLETWKGGLKTGSEITLPELAPFAPHTTWKKLDEGFSVPIQISGERAILFLKRAEEDPGKWRLATDVHTSTVWVDQGTTYSFVQIMNPGPSQLTSLKTSASQMKAQVNDINRAQTALAQAEAIKDLALRARTLQPFTSSKYYSAQSEAFVELPKSGKFALPVLRTMLNDPKYLRQNDQIVKAMGQAGGVTVGPELTRIVADETAFWQQTAPTLKEGWWNGIDIGPNGYMDWDQVEVLRNHYGKLYAALCALEKMNYGECKTSVTELRDYWRSLPQLEDKSGLSQMSEACDDILKNLAAAPTNSRPN